MALSWRTGDAKSGLQYLRGSCRCVRSISDVIGVIFDLAVTPATSPTGLTTKGAFSIVQVPSAVAFLLVGFAAGWRRKRRCGRVRPS
jgi:hypothetical protein